jgi:hypothetical protein
MLGIYLIAAIVGGGLMLFSMLAGADHDASDVDASGFDAGHDIDHGFDHGVDHDLGQADAAQGFRLGAGELVLGLFRPRNIIFFLMAFGSTGTLLEFLREPSVIGGLIPSLGMGLGAMLTTHGVFLWLKRSDSAVDAVSDFDLEGAVGRVIIPVSPGIRGRIACSLGDREVYLTARLAEGQEGALVPGKEVVVLRVRDTVAEVIPLGPAELPPTSS